MSAARAAILSKIGKALSDGPDLDARRSAAAAHVKAPERHPIPERVAGKDAAALRETFIHYAEAQSATVVEIDDWDALPSAVSDYLRDHNLPQRARLGSDAALAAAPWSDVPAMEIMSGRADPSDEVGISHAVAGIAETGTLMLASGADNPVTLNFLPETHIVAIAAADLVGPYEDAFAKTRDTFGTGEMPRTVNMISGPSRTGDIGGQIVMGAHGPRRMCIVIVGQTSGVSAGQNA